MNVLKCEFIKLKKSTSFKVCFIIMILLGIIMSYTTIQSINIIPEMYQNYDGLGILLNCFSDVAMLALFGAVFAGLFICNDFQNRTIQESIASGNSHFSVVLHKTWIYVLCTVIIFIPYPILFSILTAQNLGWGFENAGVVGADFVGRITLTIITFFFADIPMLVFFVLISFSVQKTGLSIAINVPVMIIGSRVISSLLSSSELLQKIYNYSFLGICNKPFEYLHIFEPNTLADATLQNFLPIILVSIAWSIALFALTVFIFKKRDLK